MHHAESGLYYLQSRYYDPKLGRFLNADALVSTGQGLLGNNMFAYCNNNPVVYFDPSGKALDVAMYHIREVGGGSASNDFKKPTQWKCLLGNESETAVLNAERFAFYKGALVIKVPGDSAFSFGIIFLGEDIISTNLVRHEYGHTVQLRELGVNAYVIAVVIPSVTCYWLDVNGKLPASIYYNLPWEYTADVYGRVTWEHHYWAESIGNIYWQIAELVSGSLRYTS